MFNNQNLEPARFARQPLMPLRRIQAHEYVRTRLRPALLLIGMHGDVWNPKPMRITGTLFSKRDSRQGGVKGSPQIHCFLP
jgi:hypothetical protein